MTESRTIMNTDKFPQLYYQIAGVGPSVLLLHGFPATGSLWSEVIPFLAVDFQVIVPDIPGAGNSTFSINDTLSMQILAKGIHNILVQEQISEVIIAGHSMGGYVALAFADMYPSMVKGISLVHSTAYSDSDEKKILREKTINIIQKGGKGTFVQQMIQGLFAKDYVIKRPEVIAAQISEGMKMTDENMVSLYEAMMNREDKTGVLKKGNFPIQWIIGEEDKLLPIEQTLKQCHINDVNFVSYYHKSGHMSMLEMPLVLKNDIMMFCNYCYNR